MAAEINWHTYGTKLRHCHPMYRERKCAENYNKFDTINLFLKLQAALWQFQTITVSGCCLIELFTHILFEKIIYILALKMASTGNQHCASCIGTLAFPMEIT